MSDEYTSLRIKKKTKSKLKSKKVHPNQSYDELILNLIEK